MGKSSQLKQIRGQIRQIIQEVLPEVLSEQIVEQLYKELKAKLTADLNKIDDRQRDLQSYIVRNLGVPNSAAITKPKTETTNS